MEMLKRFYNKSYKKLLILPALMILFCFVYMFVFYQTHGDFIKKDISLTGGTSVTIYQKFDIISLEKNLVGKLSDLHIREVYDLTTREQKAIIIETTQDGQETKQILEDYLGYELTDENSSFEFTGSSLSKTFYKQLLFAILLAFVFMAIVVFLIFKTFTPSVAVIISAFADILMTLVTFNILGFKMSTAGIVALLMLIGYSVDTDILLTNRLLKSHSSESTNKKIFGAFKTGMTMTLTAIVSVVISLLIVKSFSATLTQIFTVILIGLFFDIFNTWVTNASLLKWYIEGKHGKISNI